jgi:hypothetical protein
VRVQDVAVVGEGALDWISHHGYELQASIAVCEGISYEHIHVPLHGEGVHVVLCELLPVGGVREGLHLGSRVEGEVKAKAGVLQEPVIARMKHSHIGLYEVVEEIAECGACCLGYMEEKDDVTRYPLYCCGVGEVWRRDLRYEVG